MLQYAMTRKIWCAVALLIVGGSAAAGDASEFQASDYLFGDWGGERKVLHEKGLDFTAGFVGEFGINSEGGTRKVGTFPEQFVLGLDVDFGKLVNWNGTTFHIDITDRNNDKTDARAGIPTLLETQEIYGRGAYTRLTRFYVQQYFFGNKLNIKLGRADVGVDFFPFSCDFQNLSFCGSLPGYISNGWYTWPISQYFGSITYKPTADTYFKAGAFDSDKNNLLGSQGLNLTTPASNDRGTLYVAEAGILPKFGDQQLVGAYRIGTWHNTTRYPDVALNQDGQLLALVGPPAVIRKGESGAYLMVTQQITQTANGGGFALFVNWIHSDSQTDKVDEMQSVGVTLNGPFVSRPLDQIGFAAGRNHVNDRIADAETIYNALIPVGSGVAPIPVQGDEYPFELHYRYNVLPSLSLMPSINYVIHPGGTSANANALVWGMRLSARF